jgi:hypothetical protein
MDIQFDQVSWWGRQIHSTLTMSLEAMVSSEANKADLRDCQENPR